MNMIKCRSKARERKIQSKVQTDICNHSNPSSWSIELRFGQIKAIVIFKCSTTKSLDDVFEFQFHKEVNCYEKKRIKKKTNPG